MTDFPEAIHLFVDGEYLCIYDADLTIRHVDFNVGAGDPTRWSEAIVTATCKAVGAHVAWDANDNEEPISIAAAIERWHTALGAEDGFLP